MTRILTEEKKPRKSIYSKSASKSKVTLSMKNNAGAVDPDSELDDVAHVFIDKNKIKYNTVLTNTDIQSGKNSYYKLQILEADKGNR